MSTIAIEPKLYNRIEQVAREQHQSISDMLADAIQQYLWELERKKISEESATYHRRYSEIRAQYQGKYIAMRNGEIVDHATDFSTLYQRIAERFPDQPIMMTLVEDEPDRPLIKRGFRMEDVSKL